MNYPFRDKVKTGDLVLFDGHGKASRLIKSITGSQWSHIGMIVVNEALGMVQLFESTKGRGLDVFTGKYVRGVRLTMLSDAIRNCNGAVAVRRLNRPLGLFEQAAFASWRRVSMGRPYERSLFELWKAAFVGPLGKNTEALWSLFCSELVAEAYQRMGILGEPPVAPPSNEYTPADFSTECDSPLVLAGDWWLESEEYLKP